MQYWIDLFTLKSWNEFLKAGGTISGFSATRWKAVQKIQVGDRLLCYLTGFSRFIGVLEVVSQGYQDEKPIWSDSVYPSRLQVKVVIAVTPETAVPIITLKDKLSIFQNLTSPNAWTGSIRGSPARWKTEDGDMILRVLLDAKANPVLRPIDEQKANQKIKMVESKLGTIAIPQGDDPEQGAKDVSTEESASQHSQIQYLLAKIGNDMGLDVWIARNDRGKIVNGQKMSDFPRLISELPVQFDQATNQTISLIDVLWLKGKAIVSAFEVESTTSIYSGLLRMADLVAMQPNINIPLYIVAPDDRRDKVFSEINRPTFSRLVPPLRDICGYISFNSLQEKVKQVAAFLSYLKPDFLGELVEWTEVEGEDESA